jgi:hypothetical protein
VKIRMQRHQQVEQMGIQIRKLLQMELLKMWIQSHRQVGQLRIQEINVKCTLSAVNRTIIIKKLTSSLLYMRI